MSENHVRRFMGGLQTPQEVFRSHAFPKGAACASCKGPPAARFTVYVLWDDAVRRDPTLLLMDEGALAAITVRLKQGRAGTRRTGTSAGSGRLAEKERPQQKRWPVCAVWFG
jgi:hypothetical protein